MTCFRLIDSITHFFAFKLNKHVKQAQANPVSKNKAEAKTFEIERIKIQLPRKKKRKHKLKGNNSIFFNNGAPGLSTKSPNQSGLNMMPLNKQIKIACAKK